MNEFESLDQLNSVFKRGSFTLPEDIIVSGIPYRLLEGIIYTIPEMLKEGKKGFVIYSTKKRNVTDAELSKLSPEEQNLKEWIIFIWAIDSTLSIRPARVVTNTPARAKSDTNTATGNLKENSNIISDTVNVKFIQFNKQVPSKVDTGANLSSLHCEDWKINSGKNNVEFRSSLLSPNTIRTPLLDQVAIKTSEGAEYRPIIALDISINGVILKNTKFNLNDRSHMDAKILVGQNILEKGQFLVDPSIEQDRFEGIDWDDLQVQYQDVTIIKESTEDNKQKIDELYDTMINSDVTMADLAHHILTKQK